jgi:hypothetical protein
MEAILLPETPILEFIEDKINEYGREEIWGENGDWSLEELDSDFEAELLVYDEMLNTMSPKVVCIGCLKEDDELYNRYYEYDSDNDGEINFEADF